FKDPTVRTIIESIKHLFNFVDSLEEEKGQATLSRVHFHCLTFHLIAQRRATTKWKGARKAAAAASMAASKQACDTEELNLDDVELLLPLQVERGNFTTATEQTLSPEDPVLIWKEGKLEFFLVPVLV